MFKKRTKTESTRQFMKIRTITEYSIVSQDQGELVLFSIKPLNISVLSKENINARIYALMMVLKGMTEIEMCCLNSRENFEGNKRYLKKQMQIEQNSMVRNLLEEDLKFLDQIQLQMATAREFLIIIRTKNMNEKELPPFLDRIEKMLKEQRFIVKRADMHALKKILAVYFEQNVTQEQFENYDGERWVVLGE